MVANDQGYHIKAVIHNGDFAYNVQDDNGTRGDNFFQHISTAFGASRPYMITYGNHEIFGNYSNINSRFRMP